MFCFINGNYLNVKFILVSFRSFFMVQISDAFRRFGISDGDDCVMVVVVQDKSETPCFDDIVSKVDGCQIPVKDISLLSDHMKIKKVKYLYLNLD